MLNVNKNNIYVALLGSILIVILRYYEFVGNLSLKISYIFEAIGTMLISFLVITFLIYMYEKKETSINKILYTSVLSVSFISYIYYTCSSLSQVLHVPLGAFIFISIMALFIELINYICNITKFNKIKNFLIFLIIPLAIYLTFFIGNKKISDSEHKENIKEVHVGIGNLNSINMLIGGFSRIDSSNTDDKYQKFNDFLITVLKINIEHINSNSSLLKSHNKYGFCKEWKNINQDWIYENLKVKDNLTLKNYINNINNFCLDK